MLTIFKTATLALTLMSTAALADTWTLDSDRSVLGFGSIKNDDTGEAHVFQRLSGSVNDDGQAVIDIDLTSVETNIDIRNERMQEHVFGPATTATLTAKVDMDQIAALRVGDSTVTEIEGDVGFLGQDIPVFLDVFIMRMSEDQVLVTTNSMLFVSTEEAGINAGIDTLMEIAGLDGITRTFPVTLRLIFDATA